MSCDHGAVRGAVTEVRPAALEGDMPGEEVLADPLPRHDLLADPVGDGQRGMGRAQQGLVGGVIGAGGACRNGDDAGGRVGPLARQHAREEHGIGFGEVDVPQDEGVGVVDVLVAADGAIEAEAALEPRHDASGVQPRAGVQVVGAQRALEQLRGDVAVRDGPLGGAVQGHAVLAVEPDGLLDLVGHQVVRLRDRYCHESPIAPDHRLPDAVLSVQRLDRVVALHAGESLAHGGVGVAFDRHRTPALDPGQQPAADPAQATGRPLPHRCTREQRAPGHHGERDGGHGHGPRPLEKGPPIDSGHGARRRPSGPTTGATTCRALNCPIVPPRAIQS